MSPSAVVGATSLIVALFVVPKHFLVRCSVRWCRVVVIFCPSNFVCLQIRRLLG